MMRRNGTPGLTAARIEFTHDAELPGRADRVVHLGDTPGQSSRAIARSA